MGNDVDVGDDGHEVGVADPAGDDVPVEVAWEAGAGDVAEVEADIEASGIHDVAQKFQETLKFMLAFEEFFLGEISEVGLMGFGGDEDVAVVVGEAVEDGDGGFAAMEDEIFGVVILGEIAAKEAAGGFLVVLGRSDVIEPPGSPELLEEDLMVGAAVGRI